MTRKPHRFLVVIEKAEANYSGYCPDVPGCVATGATREDTEANMREALKLHLEGLEADGLPIPEPSTEAEYVAV